MAQFLARRHYAGEGVAPQASLSIPGQVSAETGAEWAVTLRLEGLETPFEQQIYGVDAVQAIELACVVLRGLEEGNGLELAAE